MTRKLYRLVAACMLAAVAVACSGDSSDVRETAFQAVGATPVALDESVEWTCGDADLQATFAPTFTGDALVAAVRSAIADPAKTDVTFSFVKPIESFDTELETRSLCMHLDGTAHSAGAEALVRRLRANGNVVAVRERTAE